MSVFRNIFFCQGQLLHINSLGNLCLSFKILKFGKCLAWDYSRAARDFCLDQFKYMRIYN